MMNMRLVFLLALMLFSGRTVQGEIANLSGRDTWISNENWEKKRDYGKSDTLRCGKKRHILIRFDVTSISQKHRIHGAVLHLANVGYPRKPRDGWPVSNA